ncbi:MAG: hypothetical protein Q4E34_05025 [Synergistaceae bacterium]|nr:hypothetical protein [Synergistaceae bacterium]
MTILLGIDGEIEIITGGAKGAADMLQKARAKGVQTYEIRYEK